MEAAITKSLVKAKRQRLIEMEAEMESIETRIGDLQWQYEFLDDGDGADELLTQRRKAIDKKKHMISEAAKVRTDIMLMENGHDGGE